HRRALLASALTLPAALVTPPLIQSVQLSTAPDDLSYLDKAAIIATPDRFSEIDPAGQHDSSAALQEAIDHVPDGGTIIFPPGRYRLDSRLTVLDEKSIRVLAHGATFVQNTSDPAFTLLGTYETIYPVEQVEVVDV